MASSFPFHFVNCNSYLPFIRKFSHLLLPYYLPYFEYISQTFVNKGHVLLYLIYLIFFHKSRNHKVLTDMIFVTKALVLFFHSAELIFILLFSFFNWQCTSVSFPLLLTQISNQQTFSTLILSLPQPVPVPLCCSKFYFYILLFTLNFSPSRLRSCPLSHRTLWDRQMSSAKSNSISHAYPHYQSQYMVKICNILFVDLSSTKLYYQR